MLKKFLKMLNTSFRMRLFVRVGAIFVFFVLLLVLCNTAFLTEYYEYSHKKDLVSVAEDIRPADLNNSEEMVEILNEIEDEYGFEVEIYQKNGRTLFSSSRGQMMDFILQGGDKLVMNHRPLMVIENKKLKGGGELERAKDNRTGNEYLIHRFNLKNDVVAEVRTQFSQIKSSASTANTFITIIGTAFLALSLGWVFWFSGKVAKPIKQMNLQAQKMAALNFEEKLVPDTNDEIGQLAVSINHLSTKLNETLQDLQTSNAKLRNEIELEHQLDVMRRGFVANVSHELKTPIAIIKGYAEGLKLDINSASREKYLDTIMDESDRMNRLVLSILTLSKYESGQIPLECKSFLLYPVVDSLAERIFVKEGVIPTVSIAKDVMVYADLGLVEQVLKSYMENALSHLNEKGEIKITAEENTAGGYTITIYNSGDPIPDEIMPQIWQSFYRGDKSHNRDSGRFGLGLSIVAAIAKMHNRPCGVYNTDDGVCFWFSLQKGNNEPCQN